MLPHINGVLETCMYVDDLSAAELFYEQVLGLTLVSRVKGRHVFFRCGHAMLLLFNPAQTTQAAGDVPPHGAHGPGHVAFAISPESIDSWRQRLNQHGVPLEAEINWPGGGKSIYFRDPAGNSLELATPQLWD